LQAESNFTYALSNLSFGIIYTENGNASQEYFEPLDQIYPVQFQTNFIGFGMPPAVFTEVEAYLEDITETAVDCDTSLNGFCTLPKNCSAYSQLTNYYFKFNFTNADDYIRVPLATFATEAASEGCEIMLTYLNQTEYADASVILGGMFI
jgi:hypothetical protein